MDIPKEVTAALSYERLFRSQIISDAADAEASLDRLIAWHFCPDRSKHGLFFLLMFREGEIFMSKKLTIAKKLLKTYHPDLAMRGAFWLKGLDRLRVLRNKLAHGRVELPHDPPPPDEAEGISMWMLKPSGESALEFISRATVDRQVRHSRHLMIAGVCLMRLVEDRALSNVDEQRQAGLLGLIDYAGAQIAADQ